MPKMLLACIDVLVGSNLPEDLVLDGFDLSGTLSEQQPSPRKSMFCYRVYRLMAVRHGRHKAHYIIQDSYVPGSNKSTTHDRPLLYDLEIDLRESRDLAESHKEVVNEIEKVKKAHQAEMRFTDSQLDRKP